MRILFYRYENICELDVLDAFRKFEFDVLEDFTEVKFKNKSITDKINHFVASFFEKNNVGNIDYIFSINFFPYVSEFCERVGLVYICWSVDSPVLELYSNAIRNKCNRIFLFDEVQYTEISTYNPQNVYYMPLAANVERWDTQLASISEDDIRNYSSDVSFVGSLYHEKSPLSVLHGCLPFDKYLNGYIEGVTEAQLLVYGYNFLQDIITEEVLRTLKTRFSDFHMLKNTVKDLDTYVVANYYLGMRVSEMERVRVLNTLAKNNRVTIYTRSNTSLMRDVICKPGITTHVQMPKVFRLSKINLNITMKGIQSGLPLRIWDVLGCGGFLLTNYQSELPYFFEVGKDLECYESIKECEEKVRYYLAHSDLREEIARNGYRKVKAMHTYEHRILSMLEIILGTGKG